MIKGNFKLNENLRIAIRIMQELEKALVPTNATRLAAQINTSPLFVQAIAHKLKKAGLIESTKGPGGGMTRPKPGGVVTPVTAVTIAQAVGYDASTDLDPNPFDVLATLERRVAEAMSSVTV